VGKKVMKTENGNFPQASICEAVTVKQGVSIRKTAKEKVKHLHFSGMCEKKNAETNYGENVSLRPHYDGRRVFTAKLEKASATYTFVFSKTYYGLTSKDCRRLVYEMATVN
jgi:hypothetical protein